MLSSLNIFSMVQKLVRNNLEWDFIFFFLLQMTETKKKTERDVVL